MGMPDRVVCVWSSDSTIATSAARLLRSETTDELVHRGVRIELAIVEPCAQCVVRRKLHGDRRRQALGGERAHLVDDRGLTVRSEGAGGREPCLMPLDLGR